MEHDHSEAYGNGKADAVLERMEDEIRRLRRKLRRRHGRDSVSHGHASAHRPGDMAGSGRELRRDMRHARIFGVIAGLARYWGVSRFWLRAGAVLALFMSFPLAVFAYLVATLLLERDDEAEDFSDIRAAGGDSRWDEAQARDYGRRGNGATAADAEDVYDFSELRARFRELEERTGQMEEGVVSDEFAMRREFRKLEE